MEFCEELNENISRHRQILYSIVSGYPFGIGDSELKNEYLKIRDCQQSQADSAVVNMSSGLYNVKGTLIDFRTVNGIRIFSVLPKKVLFSKVYASIVTIGPDSPIFEVRPISIIDCNSLCVCLIDNERQYYQFIHELSRKCCEGLKLLTVESWMVNVGDCYVVHHINIYLRVKVVKVIREEEIVVCFMVDLGTYNRFKINELFIAPEICHYAHHNLKTSKVFKDSCYVIRCCIDINKKSYNGFPTSRTGLQLALCSDSNFNNVSLKIQFLSYDTDSEAFIVNIYADDKVTMKLDEAVKKDPTLLEKDLFYGMNIDGDFDTNLFEKSISSKQHFDEFVGRCSRFFATTSN